MIKQTGYAQFTLDGAKELEGLLKEFPVRIQRDIVNAAGRAGATVLKKHIKRNVKTNRSIRSGRLYRSIKVRKAKGLHGVFHIYSDAPHAHLVEYGTAPRRFKRPRFVNLGGRIVRIEHSGSMPAKPFFRPAIYENKEEVLKAIVQRIAKRMAAESVKMSKKWGTLSKSYRKKLMK